MPVFFASSPGKVVALEDPGVPANTRLLNVDPQLDFQSHRSIITRVGISQNCNFQLTHAIGGHVYVYVFGDRVGSLTITGIAFDGLCDGSGSRHGIEDILRYYQQHRLSRRTDEVEITIGRTPIRGLLSDLNAATLDVERKLFQFDYVLRHVPEIDD